MSASEKTTSNLGQGKARYRAVYRYARVIHIYLSTLLFGLLSVFCATGVFLNHTEWFQGGSRDGYQSIELSESLRQSLVRFQFDQPDNLVLDEVRDLLKQRFNLQKPDVIEFDRLSEEIVLDYKFPAGYAAAVIDTEEGSLTIDYREGGLVMVLNDLHKGRHSGAMWSWVIDGSAILMIVFSITGMVILLQNKKHRRLGLWFAGFGALTPLLIYLFFVPRLAGL